MMKRLIFVAVLYITGVVCPIQSYSQGQLDPVRLNSVTISANMGSGAHYFGNGAGIGPAFKGYFEKGMWDLGPGVVTLGGEFTTSFFGQRYGNDWHENWVNLIFGARAAFHYGWDVEGLDTYAGVPAGIGFCFHSEDDFPGSSGFTPVFPYFGFFMGASWFFNKQFGITGEVGYSSTNASIGVIYKIR